MLLIFEILNMLQYTHCYNHQALLNEYVQFIYFVTTFTVENKYYKFVTH